MKNEMLKIKEINVCLKGKFKEYLV